EEKLKLKAKKHFEKEDYDGLIKDFSKELLNNSNNPFLLKSLARAYFRLQKYEESEKYYSRYISVKDDDDEINLEYASVLNHIGKYLDSRSILDSMIKNGQGNEDLVLLMSDNLLNMGLIEEAVTVLERFSANTNSRHVYLRLGELYTETGNLNSAYNIWLKGSKLFPDVNIFNMHLALLSYRTENYRQALRHVKKFLENDNGDFRALEFLSEILLKMKKPREAFRNWTDIIEKRPKNDRDILIKSKIFLYMERLDEALKQLELIEERLKEDVEYQFARGLAFLMHEDYNSCIEIWDSAYDTDRTEFERSFFFIVKYFDKEKIYNLFKRWDKYDDKAISSGQDL
ncbi:MAG: tetratricopeptide repeat protein, partial [Candidatus Muiribacteriaceae bacterium]